MTQQQEEINQKEAAARSETEKHKASLDIEQVQSKLAVAVATIAAAIERGEVEGTGSWHYSSIVTGKPDWLKERKINLLIQLALARHPDAPDVPTVLELAKGDEDRAIADFRQAIELDPLGSKASRDELKVLVGEAGLPPRKNMLEMLK